MCLIIEEIFIMNSLLVLYTWKFFQLCRLWLLYFR